MIKSIIYDEKYLLNYKFRLYPTRGPEARPVDVLEINRIVYNYFVSNKFTSRNDMNYALTELKEQQPILQQYHSKMLQMISTKVAGAWKSLNERKISGYHLGYANKLQFLDLKKHKCNPFTYIQSGFKIEQDENGTQIHHYALRV